MAEQASANYGMGTDADLNLGRVDHLHTDTSLNTPVF